MAGKAGGSPDPEQDFVPSSALTGRGPRGGGAELARALLLSHCRMLRRWEGAPCAALTSAVQTRSLRCPRGARAPTHSAPLPEVPLAPAAAAPHWARRRGLAAGWPPSGVSPRRPLRAPGGGPAGDPLRRGVGAGGGAGSAGAAGGTSASGPGRGRAAAGGSCSPAVVGGARGSCAVHRGLFHICNNR